MNELGFYETITVFAAPLLGIWLANRLGQKSKWSIDTQTFLKYCLAVVFGGIFLPSVALWAMAGPFWAFFLLVLVASLDYAVYVARKRSSIRKRESDLAFMQGIRENGDDDSPFGFLHLL